MIGLVSELEIAQQLRADQTEFKVSQGLLREGQTVDEYAEPHYNPQTWIACLLAGVSARLYASCRARQSRLELQITWPKLQTRATGYLQACPPKTTDVLGNGVQLR